MSKRKRSIPKGYVAVRRENPNFTFTHFLAHPASGWWVVGTKEEFDSGELLADLVEEVTNGGHLEWYSNWSNKSNMHMGVGSKIFHIIR